MIGPETYVGHTEDGRELTCTAEDANNYINPAEVEKAVQNVIDVTSEQFKNIVDALRKVKVESDDALIVKGSNIELTVESVCDAISGLPNKICGNISQMSQIAIEKHDEIQGKLNEAAKQNLRDRGAIDI